MTMLTLLVRLEGKPRSVDLSKSVVLVKWKNEGTSLTGWRWYPKENVLKGFEHPSFASGVQAGDFYDPNADDDILPKGLFVFGPSRETSDKEEGFFYGQTAAIDKSLNETQSGTKIVAKEQPFGHSKENREN